MSGLSRRRVFLSGGALGAALALPGAGAAIADTPHPDAELLAECAEFGDAGGKRTALFEAVDRLLETTGFADDVPDELLDPLHDRMDATEDAVINIEAKTLAGVLARARALAAASPDAIEPYEDSTGRDEDIARAVIRDLLAVTGGVA